MSKESNCVRCNKHPKKAGESVCKVCYDSGSGYFDMVGNDLADYFEWPDDKDAEEFGAEDDIVSLSDLDKYQLIDLINGLEDRDEYVRGFMMKLNGWELCATYGAYCDNYANADVRSKGTGWSEDYYTCIKCKKPICEDCNVNEIDEKSYCDNCVRYAYPDEMNAEEFGADEFEAKLNPTVLALRMWLIHDKSSPFQLARARYGRNTSHIDYIPTGDYKITQVEKISYDTWGDAEKKVYRMSYKSPKSERGEWLNIGDTITYAGLTTLHYDTNVSWKVSTFKYKSYPYKRDSHGSVIYNYLWANNKYSSHAYRHNRGIHSSPMPIKEMNDYWEIVSPPSKFISWYSKPANQKIVKDAFAKKEKAEEDRKNEIRRI